jgi:hypothetical protein
LLDEVREDLGVFLAAGGEVGVTADLAGDIVHGFTVLGKMLVTFLDWKKPSMTYSAYPNAPGLDVQVHEVVHHSRLQIVVYSVDDDLASNIDDLAICHVGLVLVQSFVHTLVHRYPLSEVDRRLFWVLAFIVGAGGLHFADVGHDHILVVALALNEKRLYSFGVANILDPATAAFCAVCGVKNSNEVVLSLEPLQHVGNGCFCSCLSEALALFVVGVEEICCGLGSVIAAV